MAWTPESVRAEIEYRHETAREHRMINLVRTAGNAQPSWWRRLRTEHAAPRRTAATRG